MLHSRKQVKEVFGQGAPTCKAVMESAETFV